MIGMAQLLLPSARLEGISAPDGSRRWLCVEICCPHELYPAIVPGNQLTDDDVRQLRNQGSVRLALIPRQRVHQPEPDPADPGHRWLRDPPTCYVNEPMP